MIAVYFILWMALATWFAWVLGHLVLMIFVRPDSPHFNGFSVLMPEWLEDKLTDEEYRAVWFHEKGHALRRHVWENFALVCIFRCQTPERRWAQELEADDYASIMGHGAAMASALRKLGITVCDSVRARRLEMLEINRIYQGDES